MITRILAAIGAATLAILAFWSFLLIIAPSMPTMPEPDKASAAAPMRNPALRDVSEQPHTAVTAAVQPPAPPPAPGPSPIRPLPSPAPAATLPAVPSPVPAATVPAAPAPAASASAAPLPSPQGSAGRRFLVDEGDAATGAVDAVPLRPQRRSSNCTRYRTYDPQTQSYRGYDGLVHSCP